MSDTTAQTKTIKLLLVNDSECERRMNAEYIQKRIPDILIFQASDLGRANELILTEKPQLVISDLVMPRGTYKCQVADSDDGKAENTRKWHKNIRNKGRHIATSSGFGSNDNAIPYLLNAQEMLEWITTKKEQIEKGVDQNLLLLKKVKRLSGVQNKHGLGLQDGNHVPPMMKIGILQPFNHHTHSSIE